MSAEVSCAWANVGIGDIRSTTAAMIHAFMLVSF
jgi:hypothetical protein